jgi:hypothetical protein
VPSSFFALRVFGGIRDNRRADLALNEPEGNRFIQLVYLT